MNGIDSFFHHVLTWTGTFNESGGWYGFWSGFAGGFGILTILVVGYRKINCHTQRCWRIGHHDLVVKHSETDPGTTYRVCRHCHPEIKGRRFSRGNSARCTAPTWRIKRPRRQVDLSWPRRDLRADEPRRPTTSRPPAALGADRSSPTHFESRLDLRDFSHSI